jgi:NTE family protein
MAAMSTKALVLGGGGVTGIAWEIGLLAGLAAAGLDLTDADLLIGTSAGSVVATLLATGVTLDEAFASQLAPPESEITASFGLLLMGRYVWNALLSRTPTAYAQRLGRMSLATRGVPEGDRRAVIAARLPRHEWPARRLLITAVDVESGEPLIIDRDRGIPLVDAVAASCAVPGVWPPITIGGRRYMDGGMTSVANAHLAAGSERVVVVAPIVSGVGPVPSVGAQVAELARGGSEVSLVSPDSAAQQAIGRNVLDPARRADSARAGRAQAATVLAALTRTWRGPG